MTYEALYDLAQHGYRDGVWWLAGAAVLGAALALWGWQRRRGRRSPLPAFIGAVGVVLSVGAGGVPLWDHHRLLAEFNAGRALVVEGVVSAHSVQTTLKRRQTGTSGHDRQVWESLRVAEVAFGFDRSPSPVGFRNQPETAVELRDGQRLRVHYVDDVPGDYSQRRIVRLERAP